MNDSWEEFFVSLFWAILAAAPVAWVCEAIDMSLEKQVATPVIAGFMYLELRYELNKRLRR